MTLGDFVIKRMQMRNPEKTLNRTGIYTFLSVHLIKQHELK